MHSRSGSTADGNLRRTKSTHSIVRRPSISSVAVSSVADPVVAKQHALVAATVAYERSHGVADGPQEIVRQPPQLRRRRSSRAGGFEGQGSHFGESRTPRRRQSKRTSESSGVVGHEPRSRRSTVSFGVADFSDRPSARPGLARVPSADTIQQEERFQQHRSSISVHKLRKAKSMYSSTDHTRTTSIDDISFATPHVQPPLHSPLDDTVTSLPVLDLEQTVDVTHNPAPLAVTEFGIPRKPKASHVQAMPDFTPSSVRQRASMMFMSFKKRKEKPLPATPPSALAGVETQYATIVRAPGPIHATTPRKPTETGKTGSLRSKIRSAFRRNSGALQELPVQQVNASRAYFEAAPSAEASLKENMDTNRKYSQYSATGTVSRTSLKPPPSILLRGPSPAHSDMSYTTKSRVTSWADSTIAGTVFDPIEDSQLDMIEEEPTSQDVTEKRHSSLNPFTRMRQVSKGNMCTSEDTLTSERGLSRQDNRSKSRASLVSRRVSAALESLPSQIKRATHLSKASIRTVSPDAVESRKASGATVASGSVVDTNATTPQSTSQGSSANSTVRTRRKLQKPRPVPEVATPPTSEQIAERVRRSTERWQEPLDGGHSLFFPHSPKRASRIEPEDVFATPPNPERNTKVVSPSIYSQDDCQNLDSVHELSAMPQSPATDKSDGTAVIITSHQVARYSVGSPKKPDPSRRISLEWKTWLHQETRELETPPPDDLTLNPDFTERNPRSNHHWEKSDIDDAEPTNRSYAVTPTELIEHYAQSASLEEVQEEEPVVDVREHSGTNISLHRDSDTQESEESRDSKTSLVAKPQKEQKRSRMASRYGPDDRPSSRLHDRERPSLVDRPSSRMNERFPFFDSPRTESRLSHRASTPALSLHSRSSRPTMVQKIQSAATVTESNKENATPSPAQSLPMAQQRPKLGIRRPMSSAALRSPSNLGQYTTNKYRFHSSPTVTVSTPQPSLIPRPTYSSPARRPANTRAATGSDVFARAKERRDKERKATGTFSYNTLEADPTLANIIEGPYREQRGTGASPRPLAIRKATGTTGEKRLTPSPLKENSAPASSRSGTATPTGGQRLAEQFLNARRYREGMRVMSPAEGSPEREREGGIEEMLSSPAFL